MNERIRQLLAGYVDGELSEAERHEVEQALDKSAELRSELEDFQRLKEVTAVVKYADLPDEVWEGYWQSIYRKTERGLGWILLSVGAIILLLFGGYEVFRGLYTNAEVPLWLKVGITGVAAGLIFLVVSYGRQRLFAYRRDRYREVMK